MITQNAIKNIFRAQVSRQNRSNNPIPFCILVKVRVTNTVRTENFSNKFGESFQFKAIN